MKQSKFNTEAYKTISEELGDFYHVFYSDFARSAETTKHFTAHILEEMICHLRT